MALRQLIIGRKLTELRAAMEALKPELDALTTRRDAWKVRESAAEKAFAEITDQTPAEDRAAFERESEEIEAENKAIEEAETALEARKKEIEDQITALSAELEEINKKLDPPPADHPAPDDPPADPEPTNTNNRKDNHNMTMNRRDKFNEFTKREDVKKFLAGLRNIRSVENGSLIIPEVMLTLLREDTERYSKLMKHIHTEVVHGEAKQTISAGIPEGVWMDSLGALTEKDLTYYQISVAGGKLGCFVKIENAYLADNDVNLASDVVDKIGQGLGRAIDRAIIYGTGTDMPVGIVTRLALTSQPAWWDTKAPAFVDLHTSNIGHLSASTVTGAALFKEMATILGKAKHTYVGSGSKFWVMNEKTWLKLQIELMTINSAGAVVTGAEQAMPILGGAVETLEIMPDNVIVGGYGDQYILVEREGTRIEESREAYFADDKTAYRGVARYDGKPVCGEGFAMFTLATSDGSTSSTFETDYANTDLGALVVTSAAHATTSGKTTITVTGTEASGTTLGYKIGGKVANVECGDGKTGYTAITSGDGITAGTGKIITVVEFDGDGRAVKVGSATVTAKA